jgi:hypothetical protein
MYNELRVIELQLCLGKVTKKESKHKEKRRFFVFYRLSCQSWQQEGLNLTHLLAQHGTPNSLQRHDCAIALS